MSQAPNLKYEVLLWQRGEMEQLCGKTGGRKIQNHFLLLLLSFMIIIPYSLILSYLFCISPINTKNTHALQLP